MKKRENNQFQWKLKRKTSTKAILYLPLHPIHSGSNIGRFWLLYFWDSVQYTELYTCPEGKKSANISITILVSIKTTFPLCAGRDAQQPGGGAGPAPGEPAPPGGAPEARRQGKRSGRSRVRSLLQENQHLQEELQKLAANMRVTITMA